MQPTNNLLGQPSLSSLKPLAQLHNRRLGFAGFAEAKQRAAEAEGFLVEVLTESLPMLFLYTTDMMSGRTVDWLQLIAILSSLSTGSMHGTNACINADEDPRCSSYYPEYYHLFLEKERAKLGLRVR